MTRRIACADEPIPAGDARLPDMGLIIALLVIFLVLAVVGFFVKALLWLAWVAIILFVITAVVGWIRRRAATH